MKHQIILVVGYLISCKQIPTLEIRIEADEAVLPIRAETHQPQRVRKKLLQRIYPLTMLLRHSASFNVHEQTCSILFWVHPVEAFIRKFFVDKTRRIPAAVVQ